MGADVRVTCVLAATAVLLAPLSMASMSPTNMLRDGLVVHVEFKNTIVSTQVNTVVIVDTNASLVIRIQAFHRLVPFDKYLPFNATLRLDLMPLEIDAGTNLPQFSAEHAFSFNITTGLDGRGSIAIPASVMTTADVSASVFLVVLFHCPNDPDVCTSSAHSVTTNILLDLGLHAVADISEYEEPNSHLRPTATPVTIVFS